MLYFLALLALLASFWALLRENAATLTLDHFEILPDDELPGLSIVIAARDEEGTVAAALDALLEVDYPDLEVIFVDDRSSDETLALARAKEAEDGRLRVLECKELPDGWLGKVHAQQLGVRAADKPLVLLTDADVIFAKSSLKRAVSAQRVLRCDHLTVAPRIETRGFWEPALVAFFLLLFCARFRPSRVHRDRKRYVGIGAFSLLTKEALERCDALEPLRLQVIDDVHLGRLVKSRGMRQYCVLGLEAVTVRWFKGLRGCIHGLEKNAYAGLGYSLPFALAALPAVALPFWLPPLLWTLDLPGPAVAFLLLLLLAGTMVPGGARLPKWVGAAFPVASIVLTYAFARSVWLTERQGGVRWRGTLYPLGELRRAHHQFARTVAPL